MYVILAFLSGPWNPMAWCLYMKNLEYKSLTKAVHSYISGEQNTNPMTVLMSAEDKTSISRAF